MANWIREILIKLYLLDRPVAQRDKKDRRKVERRWKGSEGDFPKPTRDSRRKKERRKKKRR